MNLKNYETVFVLTPVLNKEQITATIAKFREILLEKNAEIVYEEDMGIKKLAYPIQHKNTGIYYLIEFKATPDTISILETGYKRDENVMRFLTFSLDKHGVLYNEQKRKGTLRLKTQYFKKNTLESKEEILA
jgi:small subunit ribosomal protein S6